MATFTVQYTYDDRSSVRDEVRPAHRHFLAGLLEAGTLLASGPYTGGTLGAPVPEPDGALLLVRGDSADEVGAVLDRDPFALAGLIAARAVRPWTPVFGPWS